MTNAFAETILLQRNDASYKTGYGFVMLTTAELVTHYYGLLHIKERQFADGLKYEQRRHSYLLGRVAAKTAISRITPQAPDSIFIDNGVFQFPIVNYIAGENIQVSISHCDHSAAALAFPEKYPMAIDLEAIDSDNAALIRQQLTPHESRSWPDNCLDSRIGAVMLWTLKEALSKVLRTGLTLDWKVFEVDRISRKGIVWESSFSHIHQYKGISRVYNDHIVSIVLPGDSCLDEDCFFGK